MGVLARLYARLGAIYIVPLLVLVVIVDVIDVVSFVLVGMRYLELGGDETRRTLVFAVNASLVALLITFACMLVMVRDGFAWARGRKDSTRALAAFESIVGRAPRVIYLGGVLVGIAALPSVFRLAEQARLGIEVVIIAVTAFAAVFAAVLIIVVAAEVWLRPITDEIATYLPSDQEPRLKRQRLTRRHVPFVVIVSYLSAIYVYGIAGQAASLQERVVGTLTAASVVALTFGLMSSLALARSVASPVRKLLDATRAVRAGNLDVKVTPTANDEIGELTQSFNQMVAGLHEREALHSALGTYVDPVVADRLLREGQVLQGEEVEVTVVFVDIVGYTTRVENMEPPEVVAELNEFFQLLIPIVNTHGGHTNKLLGDGFMAVFGAPVVLADHADRALDAAFDMQHAMRERYGQRLRAGIGLNSGRVVVGTTGGSSKLDFTVIGDTVNVASRVEALTRETGDDILITASTRDALTAPPATLLPRGDTAVKGRVAPVEIFAALRERPD